MLDAMASEIDDAREQIARQTGLRFNTLGIRRLDRVYLTEELVSVTQEVAADLEISCQRMRTRTGHDAFNMLKLCPTQLIFVPSVGGMGHNEAEWTTEEHCTAGADVLFQTVVRLANRT
jgi:N-carbamoyl-L-amino-acid hydrolase